MTTSHDRSRLVEERAGVAPWLDVTSSEPRFAGSDEAVERGPMATSAERKALNEGKFRDANEQIEQAAVEIVGIEDGRFVPFLCECPQMECVQVALLTLKEYEQVRSEGRQGLAVLGHEDLTVETVLERNERFVMTEKFGRAGEVHEDNDDRHND